MMENLRNEIVQRINKADASALSVMFDVGDLMKTWDERYGPFQSHDKLGYTVADACHGHTLHNKSSAWFRKCYLFRRRFNNEERDIMLKYAMTVDQASILTPQSKRHMFLAEIGSGEREPSSIGRCRARDKLAMKDRKTAITIDLTQDAEIKRMLFYLQRELGNPRLRQMLNDNTQRLNLDSDRRQHFFDLIPSLADRRGT